MGERLDDGVKDTLRRYVAKFPPPTKFQGEEEDPWNERARQWTLRGIGQVVFEHPGQGYCSKRGDPGRPISKDSMARERPGRLTSWDLLSGTGTGHPTFIPDPEGLEIGPGTPEGGAKGQTPVPVVGKDVLGPATIPTPVPKPPTPVPPPFNFELDAYFTAGAMIRSIYLTELKRDILADPAALVNWLFHWREGGRDETWIRDRIRESDEWKKLQENK